MNQNKNDRPVSPIYLIALLWLGWPLLLPLFSLIHYLPLIARAVLLYKISDSARRKKAQKRAEEAAARRRRKKPPEPRPEKPRETKGTGNPEVDKLIKDRDMAISEMRRLNLNISDRKVSARIDDMESTTTRIFDFVIAHPEQSGQISKFLNYYLPTTLKLLNTYDRMGAQGVEGENISGTMRKVEDTLGVVTEAFHKQLDILFAGEALDVSSDITVMENLMKNEGLTDDGMGNMTLQQ